MRVFLLDSHSLFRSSLAAWLTSQEDVHVIGEACSAKQALAALRGLDPDVILTDIRLKDAPGLSALPAIRAQCPRAKIVVLTSSDSPSDINRASSMGVDGYLDKSMDLPEFLRYLRDIANGATRVSPRVAEVMFHRFSGASRLIESDGLQHVSIDALTSRERDILRMLSKGDSNKQIADTLYISANTLKNHLKSIYSKLGVHNRLQAVQTAYRLGILDRQEDPSLLRDDFAPIR